MSEANSRRDTPKPTFGRDPRSGMRRPVADSSVGRKEIHTRSHEYGEAARNDGERGFPRKWPSVGFGSTPIASLSAAWHADVWQVCKRKKYQGVLVTA